MSKPKPCSLELAKALVEGWQADVTLERISSDVWGEGYRPFRRIKTLIPAWNKMANNALWDGNINAAIKYLVNHGLANNEAVSVANEKEIKKTQKIYARNQFAIGQMKKVKDNSNRTQSMAGLRRTRLHK